MKKVSTCLIAVVLGTKEQIRPTASLMAVAFPIPDVAPVMRIVLLERSFLVL